MLDIQTFKRDLHDLKLEMELVSEVFEERIKNHYRPEALQNRKKYLESEISGFYKWHADHVRAGKSPGERIFQFQWQEITKKENELKKLCRRIQSRKEKTDGITDEMIERAKEYAFESLVELGRNRMVSCPGHEDKHPSCYIKNNYAYCFSCGRSWDTIEWVSDVEGLNFIEAVRRLQ